MSEGPVVRPRRQSRLAFVRDKLDQVDQTDDFMESCFARYSQRIQGLSEKDINDLLITASKEDREKWHYAILFALLTDANNAQRHFEHLSTLSLRDGWFACGYAVQLVITELFHKMLPNVQEQFLLLFKEAMKLNAPNTDKMMLAYVRGFNDSTPNLEVRIHLIHRFAMLLMENQPWVSQLKSKLPFIPAAAYAFARYAGDLQTGGPFEKTRQLLVDAFVWLARNRFPDIATLGRDFVLIMMKCQKAPEIAALWKDMLYHPTKFDPNFGGLEELWGRIVVNTQPFRISSYLERRIMFMLRLPPKTMNFETQMKWLDETNLRVDDNGSIRGEIIRYLIHLFPNPNPDSPAFFFMEHKFTYLTHLIISAPGNTVESQWCKMCFWLDWLGCELPVAGQDVRHFAAICEVPWALIRNALGTNVQHMVSLGNSYLEFLVKAFPIIHPPWKDRILRCMNNAARILQDTYGPIIINQVVDSVRIERSYRDSLREAFKDFVRTATPPSSTTTPTPAAPVPSSSRAESASPNLSPSHTPGSTPRRDEEEDVVVVKETAAPVAKLARVASVEEVKQRENALANLLQNVAPDVRPALEKLRDVFAATESDSERAEALQSLIGCILDNDESIDVGQMESISQCIGTIMGNIVNPDVSVLPDPLSSDSLEEAFSAPIYVLFRCLIMTPEGDSSRQPLISIIAELREVIPCVTYLLLFFLKAGGKEATDMGVSAYKDVAAAIDHSTEEQLVDDLRECAIADIRLFSYLVSFVFAKFQPESTSSADLVKTVCTFTDGNILWSVLTDLVRENVTIFRKDTFPTIVSASLNWDTAEQLIFWQFVHAEGVNHEWCSSLFTRVDTEKHPEASTNLMLILKRIDREPNMVLMRAILTRLPKDGDDMVCNAIKILIEDPDVSEKVAEIFSSILKKQIQGGDFMMPPGNNQKLKSGQKLSMEQVLSHISYFSRQCLQKDSRVGETLLARSPIKEAFHAIKKCDKAAPLRARFSDLFTLIDILNEDVDSQPSRTLRGRQTKAHPTTPKRESKGNSEDEPRSKRHKPIVLDDSDSDE